MNAIHRRAARTAARGLVAPAAALTVVAVAAPQAAAHTELDTSSPGAEATLAGLPPRVTLTFSDDMRRKYAKVAVTGPDGESVATGEPEVQGKTVALPLDAASPVGRYNVGYRVVSADGHPVSGSYIFTVTAATSPNPSPRAARSADAPPSTATRETQASESVEESSGANTSALVGGGALILVAAAVGAYVARRRRAGHVD
ncbi:copper resistance CopC family protein [Streptomyces pseudovenezuelae]|uniref:copper resistance CopC family protein n=1 Tax=Streptomyces pseudovenezuelae TaxID=67350 RepID=UPI002E331113|nr:copper resistance CopC family protein [Streptomyces pseudovenezuelae]